MPKEFDPEDPMELVGVEISGGDADMALEQIVQEYLFMGWSAKQIMVLFHTPQFTATHRLYEMKGEEYVREKVRAIAEKWASGWLTGGGSHA